jgi:IclR family acetate operon transcriptional repressor
LDILDYLRERPEGAALPEIASAIGLPKSSVFRYLATLVARRYVERDASTDAYRLGLALMMQTPVQVLAIHARPYLEEIRDRFDETANLGIFDSNRVLYIEILESAKVMRLASRSGDHDPLHSTALGKAVASQLDDQEIRRILGAEGMPRLTPKTLVDPGAYLQEVRMVRERGWAMDNGENEEGGRCLAVPITGFTVAAGISLSAPALRLPLDSIDEVATALVFAAQRLSDELAGPGDSERVG